MIIQKTLSSSLSSEARTICLDSVKATFSPVAANGYEVVLEINSNKFFLAIEQAAGIIDAFEIICVKGFVELSHRTIELLKQVVNYLLYRLSHR